MKEVKTTAVLVAVAAVLSIISVMTAPSLSKFSVEDMVGKELFPEFTDPLLAASLEIIEFDDETATPNTFKVAQVDQQWSIPSHGNYPADAEDQLADVATDLTGLKVLQVVSGDQDQAADTKRPLETYGVVDPGDGDISGVTGVGTRVVMRDQSDQTLVNLVVGKDVPDAAGLRYVRVIGQDPIYVVKLDTGKLSTKFEDWIEDDLLKLSAFDISQIRVDDYSVDVLAGTITPRAKITLDYDDAGDPRWKLTEDKTFEQAGWTDRTLAEDEELDTDALGKLKTALDDLKIVDVARKPKGLSGTLRTSGSIDLDQDALRSLQQRGFYVIPSKDPADPSREYFSLRSNDGEISVSMKDGVKYVLRFGQIAGTADKGDEAEAGEAEPAAAGMNRYLFVMAQFDRGIIPEPEYEELPQPEEQDEDAGQASEENEEGQDPVGDAEVSDETDDTAAQIEKRNQRKKEEYDKKIKKGEEKVKKLNARFAAWYYVISDEVYQKIHLGRDKIVKKKEKAEGEENPGDSGDGDFGGSAFPAPAGSLEEFDALKQDAPGGEK